MSSTSDNTPIIPPEQPCEDTCEAMYLVKRSSYTLAIATTQLSPTLLSWKQVVFQAQFKWQGQLWSCVLNPSELEMLYEDLQRLVEYLRLLHKRPDDLYRPTVRSGYLWTTRRMGGDAIGGKSQEPWGSCQGLDSTVEREPHLGKGQENVNDTTARSR